MKYMYIEEKIRSRESEYLKLLFQLLKQPSISTQNIGIEKCANLLKHIMTSSGINTEIIETDGHPIVYGEVMNHESDFTLLIYGHYDVQPPEPLNEWVTPPFEPNIRNNKIYARGAGDNKGQLLAHVLAIKTLLDLNIKIPINVKFLFEGEEENSSPNLKPFVEKHKDLLSADLVYASDGPMDSSDVPIIDLGCRGMLVLELKAEGADRDHHSGNLGNIAPNPAWSLIHLLTTMYPSENEVMIDGFYDDIREITTEEISLLRNNKFDPVKTAELSGLEKIDMDGETYFRKISLEPTFNINGLTSGYTGEGTRTIIPSAATVRLDIRLVADQNPEKIYKEIKKHINKHNPEIQIECLGMMPPSRTPVNLDVVKKVISSVRKSYGKDPIIIPSSGATGPSYLFTDVLKLPSVNVPYANADENNHAPNENMDVDLFLKGIYTTCLVLLDLADQ